MLPLAAASTDPRMEGRTDLEGAASEGDRSTCSATERNASPFQQGDNSHRAEAETMGSQPQVELLEDILHRIHALMPLRDAARVACVSRSFLRSWRCYPKLFLTGTSLHITGDASQEEEKARDFISRVDHILQNHSGMGVKLFCLQTFPGCNPHPDVVDRWLQVAITPGIEAFNLTMFGLAATKYNFPCSVLSRERNSSIRSFRLGQCSFHSAEHVGFMSRLTNLELYLVDVTGEELYGFLSNSRALVRFRLINCREVICLKIPCLLQQLNLIDVFGCTKLEKIESNAPKLSTFSYSGRVIHISFGGASQVTRVIFRCGYSSGSLYYASTKIPFIAPNLQTLELLIKYEMVNTPIAFGKFLQLKYLEIKMFAPGFSPDYDFYSMDSFLDVSPALETFVLHIVCPNIGHDAVIEDSGAGSSHPRRLSECSYGNLKNVMITRFCSVKNMIELTLHIIDRSNSLKCLTLDTTHGHGRGSFKAEKRGSFKWEKCLPMDENALVEAKKASAAIQKYIKGRVPSAANLKVIEPCSECRRL